MTITDTSILRDALRRTETWAGQQAAHVIERLERELAEAKKAHEEWVRAHQADTDAAWRENAALRENLEILHDAMRVSGALTHTQGPNYADSPRSRIVAALLEGHSQGGVNADYDPSPTPCPHHILMSSPTTANRCAKCGKLMPAPDGFFKTPLQMPSEG